MAEQGLRATVPTSRKRTHEPEEIFDQTHNAHYTPRWLGTHTLAEDVEVCPTLPAGQVSRAKLQRQRHAARGSERFHAASLSAPPKSHLHGSGMEKRHVLPMSDKLPGLQQSAFQWIQETLPFESKPDTGTQWHRPKSQSSRQLSSPQHRLHKQSWDTRLTPRPSSCKRNKVYTAPHHHGCRSATLHRPRHAQARATIRRMSPVPQVADPRQQIRGKSFAPMLDMMQNKAHQQTSVC